MALERKVVTVSVSNMDTDIAYETALKNALDAALTGGDWSIVYVEKRASSAKKDGYIIWAEKQ